MKLTRFVLLVVVLASCARGEPVAPDVRFAASAPPITVCFTPGEDCESQIIALVDGAKRSARVLAYSFTSAPIASALVRAHARRVDVGVVLDQSNVSARGSQLQALIAAGVPTWIDSAHKILHEKVIEIDGMTVELGSYNYSASANTVNAEDLVVIRSRAIASQYISNWESHRAHSEPAR